MVAMATNDTVGVAKSYIALDGRNLLNTGINHLPTGAGFLPSTSANPYSSVIMEYRKPWVHRRSRYPGNHWKKRHLLRGMK